MEGTHPLPFGPLGDHRLSAMKEVTISVPKGTFPAVVGDKVRASLAKVNGLDSLDMLVMEIITGCGVADRVRLRYDETILPFGVNSASRCTFTGFQKLCDCCITRPCYEVFGPGETVQVGVKHVFILPGDLRLDQVKLYSPDPREVSLTIQVLFGGVELFPHPEVMDSGAHSVSRVGFSSDFSSGLIPAGTEIRLEILDAPEYIYYEAPWKGLSFCLIGKWNPFAAPVVGSLRRARGVRPPPFVPPSEYPGYPDGFVVDGEGNYVVDGEGNFVIEGQPTSGTTVNDGAGNTVVDGAGNTVTE